VLNAALGQRQQLEDQVMRMRNLLSPELVKKLAARAKLGDAAVSVRVLYIEVEVDEKTKRRREVIKPEEFRWGTLKGLARLSAIGKDARKAAIARELVGAQPAISIQVVKDRVDPRHFDAILT